MRWNRRIGKAHYACQVHSFLTSQIALHSTATSATWAVHMHVKAHRTGPTPRQDGRPTPRAPWILRYKKHVICRRHMRRCTNCTGALYTLCGQSVGDGCKCDQSKDGVLKQGFPVHHAVYRPAFDREQVKRDEPALHNAILAVVCRQDIAFQLQHVRAPSTSNFESGMGEVFYRRSLAALKLDDVCTIRQIQALCLLALREVRRGAGQHLCVRADGVAAAMCTHLDCPRTHHCGLDAFWDSSTSSLGPPTARRPKSWQKRRKHAGVYFEATRAKPRHLGLLHARQGRFPLSKSAILPPCSGSGAFSGAEETKLIPNARN